jgi:hypothetical protein
MLLSLPGARPAAAQQHGDHPPPTPSGWSFGLDAQVFFTLNLQERRFRDFHGVESQNWLMAHATRAIGRARFTAHGMFSGEDYTMRRYGSPQVFQTGETYGGAALIDYQHPHDVVMAAGARLEWPVGPALLFVEGGPVASPALGPPAFMHRASAGPNPTAPLAHHHLDSTHVSHTVLTAGFTRGGVTVEASGFHGREPDEDRLRVEQGSIDSYAMRVSWRRGGWSGQVSAGHLKVPNPTEFTDHDLFTASVSHEGSWRGRPVVWTAAMGVIRESGLDVTLPAVLAEGRWGWRPRDTWYARVEWMLKDILTPGGYDPPGFDHPHVLSRVGAVTVGYERELASGRAGRLGLGADATLYDRDANLADNYGRPASAHVFLRWRGRSPDGLSAPAGVQ